MNNQTYTFGREELTFLLWLRHAPGLAGLGENPLGDATSNDISVMLATAERSLQARDWLSVTGPAQYTLEPGLDLLLNHCVSADMIVRLIAHRKELPDQAVHFYRFEHQYIAHTTPLNGVHRLEAGLSSDAVGKMLQKYIWSMEPDGNDPISYTIADSAFGAIYKIARDAGADAAQRKLTGEGLAQDDARSLALTLANPVTESTLAAYTPDRWACAPDLLLVEGDGAFWMCATMMDEPGVYRLQVSRADAPQITKYLSDWLTHIKI